MNPTYTLVLETKARGFNKKNLFNMLSHRFTTPFIVRSEGQKTLLIYGHEDDDAIVEKVETFVRYANTHCPDTSVMVYKGPIPSKKTKEMVAQMGYVQRYEED